MGISVDWVEIDNKDDNVKHATGQELGIGCLTCLEIQCGDDDDGNACVVDLSDAA